MKSQKFKQTEIGKIPEDWEVERIGDCCELIKKQFKPSKEDNKKYIGLEHIEQGTLKLSGIGDASKVISNKFIFDKGQILFGKLRPYFRKVFRPNFDGVCSTDIWVIDSKEGFDNNFLFYFFADKRIISEATSSSEGTRMPRAKWNYLSELEFAFPSLQEQIAIAKILSSLDTKIELNQQMNKTLEAIGQAIFKKWFVEGKKKNWEVGKLGECISFFKGKKPNELFNNKEEKFLPQILINVLDGATPQYVLPEDLVTLNENEPLMVMDGASSGRIEIGFNGIIGSTLSKIICKNKQLNNYYIYYFLKSKQKDINKNTTGTSIPHTDKGKIKNYKIYLPDKNKLELFDKLAMLINQKIMNNKKQSQTLSQIRDVLLPKLMSGEVRVK